MSVSNHGCIEMQGKDIYISIPLVRLVAPEQMEEFITKVKEMLISELNTDVLEMV